MQLSINPKTDQLSSDRTKGNESPNADAKRQVIPMAKKILLCSSDEIVARRWHEALNGVENPSSVATPEALISSLKKGQAEIVLVDLDLFGEDYQQIPQLLCQQFPKVAFIVLSAAPNDVEGLYLITNGIKGYCNRYISHALLLKAVELVRMGEVWVGRSLLFKLMSRLSAVSPSKLTDDGKKADIEAKLAKLTDRESEIARLVGAGDSNKVIAKKLDITERTVKAHLSSIFRKTTTKDRLQLGLLINT